MDANGDNTQAFNNSIMYSTFTANLEFNSVLDLRKLILGQTSIALDVGGFLVKTRNEY